jgi:hypothetical protein
MNEILDIALFGILAVVNMVLTIGILIMGISMVYKAIDYAKWSLYDQYREPTDKEWEEINADLERINRK